MATERVQLLGAHAFEPSDDLSRLDKAGRPMRICRVCGRPGRGSGHRINGLRPMPHDTHRTEKVERQRERREPTPLPTSIVERLAPSLVKAGVILPTDRHPFEADPSGRRVESLGAHDNIASWPACVHCGKDRRAHPRRSHAEVVNASTVTVPTSPAPAPSPVPIQGSFRRSTPIRANTASELVVLAMAIDHVLAAPAESVDWRLRMRLVAAREVMDIPSLPSMYVDAEQVAPAVEPATETLVRVRPDLAPIQLPPSDDAILRGIRNDRVRELAKRAARAGWTLSITGSGHLKLGRGSQTMILSTTMGDGRRGHSWGNARAQAKRLGIDVSGL